LEVKSHKDLIAWQKAMDFAAGVYCLVGKFPAKETYGLWSQLTRAAASVPANIAEGKARGTTKDYSHFLSVARGSLMEAETHLLLAIRVGYISDDDAVASLALIDEVGRLINAIRSKLLIPNP
jgi:four helix bundle protein